MQMEYIRSNRKSETMQSILRTSILLLLCGAMTLADVIAARALPTTTPAVTQTDADPGLHAGKRKKKKKSNQTQQRTYTRRGNPDVTRRVATELLIEHLPQLAALIDLEATSAVPTDSTSASTDAVDDSEDVTASIPTAEGTRVTTGGDAYEDREMLDEEDPDRLTMEDEEYLELTDEDMSIDAFYEDFTEYMRGLHGELHITDNGIDMIVAMESLMSWLGTRYLFGGTSRSGIDCSAFTRTMYRECGLQLPRTAAMQWDAGGESVEREALQFGDLVFFHTRQAVYVSHVGIYLGNGMFCHASSRNGVTVSSLESNYYSTHFIGARRFDFTDTEESTEAQTAEVTHPTGTDSLSADVTPALARTDG